MDVLRSLGPSNAALAERCCWAIGSTPHGNAENRVKYGAVAGSMEALVDVLKAHGKNPDSNHALVQCCWAIEKLCELNASNVSKLKSLNIIHELQHEVTVYVSYKSKALNALG